MAYVKNTWVDQKVQRPKTYNFTTNDDGSTTLIDAFGDVEELGTPVNADNMNHIEDGLANVGIWTYSATVEYNKDDAVIRIVNDEFVLYKSKQDENKGNALTNTDYWEEVKLGGSGLEVCDIGMSLFVDETKGLRRYLNGQIVDRNDNTEAFFTRLQKITTLHPSLLCTEEEWQTAKTMSVFGQVGKFVFNYSGDAIVSVRLPRVVNVQGLFDLQNLGMMVAESLPNIVGTVGNIAFVNNVRNFTGCFYQKTYHGYTGAGTQYQGQTSGIVEVGAKASLSSSTYQDNAHVQQEAIQYPYFIQIATGQEAENNIVNDIELNNPYSLFDHKYSDHELNNLSWLKSEAQWNAKTVYTDAYDKLLKVYNGTEIVEGLSVKLSTETYTDYDFVLNASDETFRLPLKTKLASGKAIVGNGMTLGLTNGTENGGLAGYSNGSTNANIAYKDTYGVTVGNATTGTSVTASLGVTTDPTKSGIELSDSGLYLYFYVGETVQNANLIDAGRIVERLATKTDILQASGAGMPSNKHIDLTLGANGSTYTAPANGYYCLRRTLTSAGFQRLSSTIYSEVRTHINGGDVTNFLPIKKGDTLVVTYDGNYSSYNFIFVYAEGEA